MEELGTLPNPKTGTLSVLASLRENPLFGPLYFLLDFPKALGLEWLQRRPEHPKMKTSETMTQVCSPSLPSAAGWVPATLPPCHPDTSLRRRPNP